MRLFRVALLLAAVISAAPVGAAERSSSSSSSSSASPSRFETARQHYKAGVELFEAGNKEQALVEFQLADEIAPKRENVFMIAQCEYHLGQLVNARTHYRAFLAEQSTGELADLARLRIEAINRRPGVFAINTVPDAVDVRIEGEGKVVTGQAPNEFQVPRGSYRVTVSKPNYGTEIRELAIEVAETKPLFFKLEPVPAHLTIRTTPANAALFVRGNRAQNPYDQDVPPGSYEIYAEASYYQSKRETITLAPGDRRVVEFPLTYVQRSGRPELIGFWTGIGAVGGGLLVLTQGDTSNSSAPLSLSLFTAGILAGGIGLGVVSSTTTLVPEYIRDNVALFRMGASWIGDLEGATIAMGLTHSWTPTWVGGAVGLTAGAFAGWWFDDYAPNYGRVAMIQSAALLGTLAGALAVPAVGAYPASVPAPPKDLCRGTPTDGRCLAFNNYRNLIKTRLAWGMLAGLNVGLATGLAMAYLPDQSNYGPSWQRVLMVDLAGIAGAIFATTIELCSRPDSDACANQDTKFTSRTARFALVGATLGLFTGWLLTMDFDRQRLERPELPLSFIPLPGALPVESRSGTAELVPGLVSHGRF